MKGIFMKQFVLFLIALAFISSAYAQVKNKGVFVKPKSEYYEANKKAVEEFNKKPASENKAFKVDFTGLDLPKAKSEFTYQWHNDPINQGMTGTCWDFSTTSFFESEIYRLNKKKVKLSEMYTAYWEYVEKARRFVQERGNSAFAEGSEGNAVKRIWNQYGVVPASAYGGMLPGQKVHDHSKLVDEMTAYLQGLKTSNAWNEDEAVSTIKSILNHYLGVPPTKCTYEGKEFTPKEFLDKVVNLKLDDYVDIISLMEKPYYTKMMYNVPDNWWLDSSYYNVPLDEYMSIIKNAIRKGYTMVIGGDVSEPGIESHAKVAMIPTFDIPSEYIDENAREFRFVNKTTTDDHGIHLVGYLNKNGKDWYLIKDSGAGAYNVDDKGYYYYSEDYVKLKIVDFCVHKDMVEDILNKFSK
jgi:bleomycin hydrolase